MSKTIYHRTVITGGGTALDGIDGATLADGDAAIVILSNQAYFYLLNATSGATESSPGIIAPDTNPGTKRWILQNTPDYEIDSRSYATLELADAAAVAAGKQLVIAKNHTLTANTVLAASILRRPGGSFTKASTYTLTFSGSFQNPDNGVAFIGFAAGDITYAVGSIEHQRLEWYGGAGDNSTDNTTPLAIAMGAQNNPVVKLLAGIYLGIVNTGTKNTTISGVSGNFGWTPLYVGNSTLKNNSTSTPLVTVGSSSGTKITDVYLHNNNKPAHTLQATNATYLQLDKLFVRYHGNETTESKFGIYLDQCTLAKIGTINFADMLDLGTGLQSAYGGHFKILDTNAPNIDFLTAGKAGVSNTSVGFWFSGVTGGRAGILSIDAGGGGGALYVQSTSGFKIESFYTELTTEAICLVESWMRLESNFGFKISSIHMYHHENSGTIKPLIGLRDNRAIEIDTFEFRRTLNDGTVPIMQFFDAANKVIKIKNIYARNHFNDAGSVAVAYTFIDTDNKLSSQVIFENFYEHSAGATHNLVNIDGLITNNVEGVQFFNANSGIIVNNPGTYPLAAGEPMTCEGLNALFQELQQYQVSAALSGATGTIAIQLGSNVQIIGVTLRVNTLITGATSWNAAFSGGASDVIGTGYAVAKNTKAIKMYGTLPVTTTSTDILLTAVGGNFTAGVISAVVRYRAVRTIADAP